MLSQILPLNLIVRTTIISVNFFFSYILILDMEGNISLIIKFYLPPLLFSARWRLCHGHRPVLPAHLLRPCLVVHLYSGPSLHSPVTEGLVLMFVGALRSILSVLRLVEECFYFVLTVTVPLSSSWDANRSTEEPVTSSGGPRLPPSPLPPPSIPTHLLVVTTVT